MSATSPDVDVALPSRATLGEGPVWDAALGRLLWVDIMEGEIHAFDPATGDDRVFRTGEPVGVVRPRRSGGLVLALEHGFATLDPAWRALRRGATVDQPGPAWRFNDGGCDPQGRFWAGTMAYDFTPGAGVLYRLDPGGDVQPVLDGATISNGMAWSHDGQTLYYVDTPTGGIDAFAFDGEIGAIHSRRRVATIDTRDGTPDGLTIDEEGCLWVALVDGGAIRRYRPDGRLELHVPLPAMKVTAVAFGGPALDTLFATTARLGLDSRQLEHQPDAGALFALSPGVRGVPLHAFAG